MIPCYVTGKGMYASSVTWEFKVALIQLLETSGLGYDTRFRYYRAQFPSTPLNELARRICDPIEYYDLDWPAWRAAHVHISDEIALVTDFFLERDTVFRNEAEAAIFCFDEAGFGSGVNVMRFLQQEKPVLGFYHADEAQRGSRVNIGNVLQLLREYPQQMTLYRYSSIEDICLLATNWLRAL